MLCRDFLVLPRDQHERRKRALDLNYGGSGPFEVRC